MWHSIARYIWAMFSDYTSILKNLSRNRMLVLGSCCALFDFGAPCSLLRRPWLRVALALCHSSTTPSRLSTFQGPIYLAVFDQ